MSGLEMAKEKLTIPDLWEKRGWPGEPGKACRVPYRDDTNPSGSVFHDGMLFHDFGSGETLDAPALLAKVEDLDSPTSCRIFLELAGIDSNAPARVNVSGTYRKRPARKEARTKPTLPLLREPTSEEMERIASDRGIRPGACDLARYLGFLRVTDWCGIPVWAITDATGWSIQYRRIDGKPFDIRGAEVKAITGKGSWGRWPIGIREAGERKTVSRAILCEGSTDFLAGFSLIWEEKAEEAVQPVAMLGAGGMIPDEAIPHFRNVREVLIVPDLDQAGSASAFRWEKQLLEAGVSASCYDLSGLFRADGKPVKDLNDLCLMEPGELERLSPIVSYESQLTEIDAYAKTV